MATLRLRNRELFNISETDIFLTVNLLQTEISRSVPLAQLLHRIRKIKAVLSNQDETALSGIICKAKVE